VTAVRSLPLLVLATLVAVGAVAAGLAPAAAGRAAPAPPVLHGLTAWTAVGDRIAFVARIGGRDGLWVERFGSNQPVRLAPAHCGPHEEQVDALAPGPSGSWACLERTVGNTEAYFSVDLVSRTGTVRHVASAGGPISDGQMTGDSIPFVFGDGSFLGFLHVAGSGTVTLMQIVPSGRARRVADLTGVSAPDAVATDSGHVVVRERGTVQVFTTAGAPVASFAARAASVAVRRDRVVVRTTDRRLDSYTLAGRRVSSYPLAAASWTAGLATYAGYAAYLGANKAVHVVKLATGRDRVVARAGAGWFFDGVSLQAAGAAAPLTTQRGGQFLVTFRFLPMASLLAAVG